jgi:hypothetical protein
MELRYKDGVEIQLFAQALISIAHLFYRLEPEPIVENVADRALQRIFQDRSLQPNAAAVTRANWAALLRTRMRSAAV